VPSASPRFPLFFKHIKQIMCFNLTLGAVTHSKGRAQTRQVIGKWREGDAAILPRLGIRYRSTLGCASRQWSMASRLKRQSLPTLKAGMRFCLSKR
jgi:hypothetical protein